MMSTITRVLVASSLALALGSAPEPPVELLTAGNYAILAKSGISTVPASAITGNIGVSPIAASAMTGFTLIMDASNQFSTSTQVTGKAYAPGYTSPTPSAMTTAVSNMEAAYTDAKGRVNPDAARINLGAGTLGGAYGGSTAPLTAGVYTFSTDVKITDDLFITGSATDIFIIQVAGNVIVDANKRVTLTGGALAKNIFWAVAQDVTVQAGGHMEGVILCKTKVDFITGSTLNGRILTQTAANLQVATITEPV